MKYRVLAGTTDSYRSKGVGYVSDILAAQLVTYSVLLK